MSKKFPSLTKYLIRYITLQSLRQALDEAELAQLKEATQRSLQESELNQAGMIRNGLTFLQNWGVHCEEPPRTVPTDGDCLQSSVALAQHPRSSVLELHDLASDLRIDSVSFAMDMIPEMSEERLERLQHVAGSQESRERLMRMLSTYRRNGQYQGDMGDLMPIVVAAYLGTPLLIIDLSVVGYYHGVFIRPDEVFDVDTASNIPFVVVRQGQHLFISDTFIE